MSNNNNIYTILNNFNNIAKDQPASVAAPKAKTKLQESMEQVVNEKYMGFKKVAAAAKAGGAENPEAVAASIGRKKYGKEKFQKAAAAGKKLNEKTVNPYAVGMAVAKKKAGITAKPAHDLPKKVIKKAHEIAKKIDEGQDATTYTVAYKDPKKPGKSYSTQVKATSAAEAKAAFQEWDTTNRFTYLGSRPDVDKVHEDLELDEGWQDMMKAADKRAKEKGTGKFDKKEISTGTVYTRKYDPKTGETDDSENITAVKKGRGRPKKSAFESYIADFEKALTEGTVYTAKMGQPPQDIDGRSATPTTTPTPKTSVPKAPAPTASAPKAPVGSIQGGVWTATPPKPGQPGVPVPQGLDEVDAEMEGASPAHSGLKDPSAAAKYDSFMQQRKNDSAAMVAKINPPMAKEAEELDEVDVEMEGMRKLAGLKGGQKKLDRDHDGKLTGNDFAMLRKGLEEGGDDYEELQDKIQWLMGAPNYLKSDEARETAAYTPDTDPIWNGYRDDTDDVEEGNAFSGAVAKAKADGVQPGEKITVGGKEYDLKEGDDELNQMRRIAGLKECGMSPIGGMASDMEKQQGSMNISTNQNSSGAKSVTITADGDAANSLMQMLKLAGMGGDSQPDEDQGMIVVAQDSHEGQEQEMEEEKDPRYHASTTPDEQVSPVQAQTKGGNGDVAGQEKKMKPGGYQFGDNNHAMQESARLMKEYNSIKVKK